MIRKTMFMTLVLVLALAGLALARPLVTETWKSLDSDTWRVYNNSSSGEVSVADGQLTIAGTDGGWKQTGIALVDSINLTGKVTTISVSFVKAGFTQQMPALASNGDINGADVWSFPTFRVAVNADAKGRATASVEGSGLFVDKKVEGYVGGAIKSSKNSLSKLMKTFPFTLKWVFDNTAGGPSLNTQILVNDEVGWIGTITTGTFDISDCYLYIFVSNDKGEGPTVLGPVSVDQK